MNNVIEYLRERESEGCTINDLITALENLSNYADPSGTAADEQPKYVKSMDLRVSELLTELGMPRNIKGFKYARTAIILAYENPNMVDAITKELYPEVAKLYGTTPSRTERAIRHATEVTWDRGDLDVLKKYFGNTISSRRAKPTNSEFIAMLADYLRLHG